MKKIIVIGSPGAGKSIFSKKLKEIFKQDKWIIDGNYQRTLELRLKECDTVFLLDIATEDCLQGAKARVGKKRDDMPWVEEKLDENFKQCILDFANEKLPKIYELLEKYKNNLNIIIFKSRDEADNYIINYDASKKIRSRKVIC